MAQNEKTSEKVAAIAARLLRDPSKATQKEIRTLAGAALTQVPDRPKRRPKRKAK